MKKCKYCKIIYLKKSYQRKTEDNEITYFNINSNNKDNFHVLMNIIIFIFIFHIILISKIVNCDQIFTRKLSNNFIILKVNEIGKIRLLGNNIQKPSQIIINGIDVGPNT